MWYWYYTEDGAPETWTVGYATEWEAWRGAAEAAECGNLCADDVATVTFVP